MTRDPNVLREDALFPRLTRSPESVDLSRPPPISQGLNDPLIGRYGGADKDDEDEYEDEPRARGSFFAAMAQRNEKRDSLHPYTQTLGPADVDSCVVVEDAAFPPDERATREKFESRLRTCGSLSMGIFTSSTPSSDSAFIPTASTSQPVYSPAPARKAVLLGHIIATKGLHPTVTDEDMMIPPSSTSKDSQSKKIGHQENGTTLCIHSLAILPSHQNHGLGKTLLKAYLQRMQTQEVAKTVAIIAHPGLVGFYEKLGFVSRGESKVVFGGGGWVDLNLDLRTWRAGWESAGSLREDLEDEEF